MWYNGSYMAQGMIPSINDTRYPFTSSGHTGIDCEKNAISGDAVQQPGKYFTGRKLHRLEVIM